MAATGSIQPSHAAPYNSLLRTRKPSITPAARESPEIGEAAAQSTARHHNAERPPPPLPQDWTPRDGRRPRRRHPCTGFARRWTPAAAREDEQVGGVGGGGDLVAARVAKLGDAGACS